MLIKLRCIGAVLFCEFVHAIYVYNPGNPNEYLNPNPEAGAVEEGPGYAEKYAFGDVEKDYGIVNISTLGALGNVEDQRDKRRNRIGFYNVQTGDEFFLNDFEDIITTKKPATSDNPRVGVTNQRRPQQHINNNNNNRRKNNNKTTNNRRKPAKKQQNRNSNKRPINNRNKNTNNKKNNRQTNKRRPQQTQYSCRNPNVPLKNVNVNVNVKRRPATNNKKNTVIRPQIHNNNNNKPVRKVSNKRQNVKIKNNIRKNIIQSRDSTNISDVIKKYISKLKSKDFERSVKQSARSLNGRSLLSDALNQIRDHSMNLANRFLSFFTVVERPNYQCIADSDFNYYEGVCYQEKQCLKLGGTPLGNCSSYDRCCVFKSSCGATTSQNCTYFESPNYPKYFPDIQDTDNPDVLLEDPSYDLGYDDASEEPTTIPTISDGVTDGVLPFDSIGDEFFVETGALTDIPLAMDEATTEEGFVEDFDVTEDIDRYRESAIARANQQQGENLAENFACSFKIFKTSEKVQQMKVEFIDLELLGPNRNGDCLNERLIISGQNLKTSVPIICGFNSGQHIYVDVSTLTGPLQISILSTDVYAKRYKFRVCQLETPCMNALNCLQYYSGVEGVISSFNYDQAVKFPRSDAQYLNNLNFAICIKREIGYCSTTFTNLDEDNVEYPFEIINEDDDLDEFSVGPDGCPHDYLVINNMRICGRTFKPITEEGSGPVIIIPFHSSQHSTGVGFKLVYTQNQCTN